jgi:N-acetylglutamate synthase-like GNAT family acetyltransferase
MFHANPASSPDLTGIRALLERSGLPTSDLESARPQFAVVRAEGEVIAAGALQRFGSSALLRSVVVAPNHRNGGLGHLIVKELERFARAAEITQLILLTQTAVEFFAHQGYRVVERNSAPEEMQDCEEFRSLCPASATCMAKSLKDSV